MPWTAMQEMQKRFPNPSPQDTEQSSAPKSLGADRCITALASTASFSKALSPGLTFPNTLQTIGSHGTKHLHPFCSARCIVPNNISVRGRCPAAQHSCWQPPGQPQIHGATDSLFGDRNISVKCLASHLTDLKRFLLLTIMFKCQNKTSVLSVTTDSYLGKMTPGLTTKGCSSWAPSMFIFDWLQKQAALWLGVFVKVYFDI